MRVDTIPTERWVGPATTQSAAKADRPFGAVLAESLERVNALQHEADSAAAALAVGHADNLHNVMIASEQAHLALQLVVTIRNRVVEAYQEISRMQV